MSDISLTASMRSNLLSLQNTQSLMDTTQERLSTGKKVNSAIDNPSSYYTAQSLTNRASDLEGLLDSMGQGIQTIQAANEGIEAITTFVQQAKAVANTARDTAVKTSLKAGADVGTLADGDTRKVTIKIGDQTKDITITGKAAPGSKIADVVGDLNTALSSMALPEGVGDGTKGDDNWDDIFVFAAGSGADADKITLSIKAGKEEFMDSANINISGWDAVAMSGKINPHDREASVTQFNEILGQIDQIASDSSYKGINLLKGDDLKVIFNEDRSSYLDVEGKDATSGGLKLSAVTDWSTSDAVDTSISQVEAAINTLRDMASEFGNNYSIVQTRQDFTENLINVLEEGADDLTLADMNEESANMLALQTRQQLAINSLSLASQAAQSVLSLF